jgi:hypothetical protein
MRVASTFGLLVLAIGGCSAGGGRARDAGGGGDFDSGIVRREDAGAMGTDTCSNGIDDNGDGLIDENCPCTEGERQACWPGTATRRGVGACRDGVQICEPYVEFTAWSQCTGAVLPGAEITGNGIDEDCDGADAGGRTCLANEFGESCGGGDDDDCDGLVDCDDPDCSTSAGCAGSCTPSEESCDDGIDNDCDGAGDCLDPDCDAHANCAPPPPPPPGCTAQFPFFLEIQCGDSRDNDCDRNIDCADSDCVKPGSCGCPSREDACGDGTDNDCDGDVDCGDLDCQACTPGMWRWCDDPQYCHWGRQDCGSDGRWGTCVEVDDAPGDCGDAGRTYSATCCVDAGACCQNYPVDDTSIGNCTGIVSCRP